MTKIVGQVYIYWCSYSAIWTTWWPIKRFELKSNEVVMRTLMSLLVVVLFQNSVFAQKLNRLVVSDIDDTLKISHVLSSTGKFVRALDIEAAFVGMPTLFQLIAAQPEYNTKIVYLTNAPQTVAGVPVMKYSHQSFLANNNFPVGLVALNPDWHDVNFKLNYLRQILSTEPIQELILFGDNGERDTEIYSQIQNEFSPKIKIITFIHQIYSSEPLGFLDWLLRFDRSDEAGRGKKLLPNQIGYVTPIEVALELKKQNRFHNESWNWMMQKILPKVLQSNFAVAGMAVPQTFPSYMKCSDFIWRWEITSELENFVKVIQKRCR